MYIYTLPGWMLAHMVWVARSQYPPFRGRLTARHTIWWVVQQSLFREVAALSVMTMHTATISFVTVPLRNIP